MATSASLHQHIPLGLGQHTNDTIPQRILFLPAESMGTQEEVKKACAEIASFPPLVFAGECRTLQERLAKCATGEAFILQGGDCAEAFSQFSANRIRDLFRLILQVGWHLGRGEGGRPMPAASDRLCLCLKGPGSGESLKLATKSVFFMLRTLCQTVCKECPCLVLGMKKKAHPLLRGSSAVSRSKLPCHRCSARQPGLLRLLPAIVSDERGDDVWRRRARGQAGPPGRPVCQAAVGAHGAEGRRGAALLPRRHH